MSAKRRLMTKFEGLPAYHRYQLVMGQWRTISVISQRGQFWRTLVYNSRRNSPTLTQDIYPHIVGNLYKKGDTSIIFLIHGQQNFSVPCKVPLTCYNYCKILLVLIKQKLQLLMISLSVMFRFLPWKHSVPVQQEI